MALTEKPGAPRPTLKTIASIAGLGVSTVSRALQDGPEISLLTRQRVKEIAREIGYHPNRAGVRLRTGKTNVINLVIETTANQMGLVTGLICGITDVLAGTSYHLVVTPHSVHDPISPLRYMIDTHGADGVILSRIEPHDPRITFLAERGTPFATHGRSELDVVHPYHDFDNEAFAREAVRRLDMRGRRLIGFFGPDYKYTFHKHLRLGFETELQRHAMTEFPIAGINTDSSPLEIRAFAEALVSLDRKPDGIVCSGFTPAMFLCTALEKLGLVIGQDIDVVVKRSPEFGGFMTNDLIGIDEDFREAGRDLAKFVVAWINGTDPASLQRVVGPKL